MPGSEEFPDGFFSRDDAAPDAVFYRPPRLVTHIDAGAISAVAELYDELDIDGRVLDLMSSWISHFTRPPARLTVLGMNGAELAHNDAAADAVIHDLNRDPTLPFVDDSFDAAVCCVSVDYLVAPIEVFVEVARVVRPGGRFVVTFSNRCFPTKAIRGWLNANDAGHLDLVVRYFELADRFGPVTAQTRPTAQHDPLHAVWASVRAPQPRLSRSARPTDGG